MTEVFAFVFTGDRNQEGKSDYVGAFDPEARAFMKLHNIPQECRLRVNLSAGEQARRKQIVDFVEDLLAKGYRTKSFAWFCHGFTNRIELGFKIANISQLVDLIKRSVPDQAETGVIVPLYCCSTASGPGNDGDNGFADKLRDALCQAGLVNCRVDGHVTAGHATQNSMTRRYEGMGSVSGGVGGFWICAPQSPLWKAWRKSLTSKTDMFRFKFPYMPVADIHAYLSTVK